MFRMQVTLKQLEEVLKPFSYHGELSWKETLEYWCEKILIRHFEAGNETAYGYPKLDPKYLKRKQKMWGNQPMLVASGLLRESVTSMYKIYRVAGKFRVVLNVPGYGRYVKEIRDYTLINKRDMKDLTRFWKTDFKKRRRAFANQIRMKKF